MLAACAEFNNTLYRAIKKPAIYYNSNPPQSYEPDSTEIVFDEDEEEDDITSYSEAARRVAFHVSDKVYNKHIVSTHIALYTSAYKSSPDFYPWLSLRYFVLQILSDLSSGDFMSPV